MRKRVVILGAGFGGLNAAQALKNAPVDITIIDRTNHHLFQPLLYQVASAALSPSDIAVPIREVVRDQENCTVLLSNAIAIHKKRQVVELEHADPIEYDYLIVATGARHSYFGHPRWESLAPGIKTLRDAQLIREHLLMSFEIAERTPKEKDVQPYLNFAIIGAGPTGVEMAGAIAEIAYKTLIREFTHIDIRKSCIYLIEAAPDVLPTFHPRLRRIARHDLEKLGVTVLTDTKVTNITEEGVETATGFIPTKNIVWAAGNEAGPLLKTLDTPLDRQGRVQVEPDLTVPGYSNLFVIGDAACVLEEGHPLPAVAPAAIQQGRYVASIISGRRKNRKPFRYRDKGSMATIGLYKAVASAGPIAFGGLLAWLSWCFIHVAYLVTFRTRFLVMMQWFFWLITGKRSSRLITLR